jgi:hypothetical protein
MQRRGVLVTLINTNGMAFLGPGSEWFWTALQFIALAITFYAIYRQLRGQQEQMREGTKLLRTQAHYNALMLHQRPEEIVIEIDGMARIVLDGRDARCAGRCRLVQVQ